MKVFCGVILAAFVADWFHMTHGEWFGVAALLVIAGVALWLESLKV